MTDLPPPPGALPPPPPPHGKGGFPPPPPPPPAAYGQAPPSGGWAQPVGPRAPVFAGFWRRFGAVLIDTIIFWIPSAIISYVAGQNVPTEIVGCDEGLCEQPTGSGWAILALISLVELAAILWYWAELEGRRGQTLGKMALDIRTIDVATGGTIGAGRAIGRVFSRIISTLPCLLGYFWMLWDGKKQTWHDKVVNSVVVRA